MNSIIPYIIERQLLHNRAVELPEIGTLFLQRESASFVEGRDDLLYPPYDTLCLAESLIGGLDIVELTSQYLKQNSNIGNYFDEEQFYLNAVDLYNEWRENNITQSCITVDGVCRVELTNRGSILTIADTFQSLLMPYGDSYINIGSDRHSAVATQTNDEHSALHIEALEQRIKELEQELSAAKQQIQLKRSEQPLVPRRRLRISRVPLLLTITIVLILIAATIYFTVQYLKVYNPTI